MTDNKITTGAHQKGLRKMAVTRNPFILFLPFLVLYVGFVLVLQNNAFWGDEEKYYNAVLRLLKGSFSPPPPGINLETGPGYPFFMLPFVAVDLPFVWIKLMNAALQYLSVICLFKALRHIVSFKAALVFSLFWGCYFHSFDYMAFMLPESLSTFLAALLLLLVVKAFIKPQSKNANRYIYLAGLTLGCLALTKVVFGYIIVFTLIVSGFFWVMTRWSANYKRVVLISLVALTTTLPYLVYTYQLTGRFLYWGTSGGNNLYWMTTPFSDEYGDWLPPPKNDSISKSTDKLETGGILSIKNKSDYTPGREDSIKSHHVKNFAIINRYKGAEKDDAYKRIAINNVESHPAKFMLNWLCNVGRILFNYPYSYTYQKPTILLRLPLNGIILVSMIYCLFPTILNWQKLPISIRLMLLFAFIYLGVSTLGSAETRMFTIAVPMLLVWIAFVTTKSINIKVRDWEGL